MKLTFDSIPDIIYGEMYGRNRNNSDATIINIRKSELHKTVEDDSVIYVWGWPGPDGNIYKYSDYGETWAFTIDELRPALTWEERHSHDVEVNKN